MSAVALTVPGYPARPVGPLARARARVTRA